MNIKALASSALLATTALFSGVGDAEARNYCYQTTGYDNICIHWVKGYNSNPQEYKRVGYSINGSYYEQDIDCNRRNGVNRFNYKNNLSGKVCFEYN